MHAKTDCLSNRSRFSGDEVWRNGEVLGHFDQSVAMDFRDFMTLPDGQRIRFLQRNCQVQGRSAPGHHSTMHSQRWSSCDSYNVSRSSRLSQQSVPHSCIASLMVRPKCSCFRNRGFNFNRLDLCVRKCGFAFMPPVCVAFDDRRHTHTQ